MIKKPKSTITNKNAGKKPSPKATGPDNEIKNLTREFLRHLFYTQGRTLEMATPNDLYMALAVTVRN